jgi:hypothetical protein
MEGFLAAVASSNIPVTQPQTIDFSILDVLLGLGAGIVSTVFIFVLIGYALIKFRIVTLGSAIVDIEKPIVICPDNCPAHLAEYERSLQNQTKINALFDKYDEHQHTLSDLKMNLAVLKQGQDQILSQVKLLTEAIITGR